MYPDLITFPIKHKNLQWTASEALLDIKGVPHLFTMIKLTGTRFIARARVAQVWVGETHARIVTFDEDALVVRAYFDDTPPEGDIYFGHSGNAELNFERFDPSKVKKLDRARLPKNVKIR